MLLQHIDNSAVVIGLAARFLVEHCGASKLQKYKQYVRRFAQRARKRIQQRAAREIAQETLEKILQKMNYIPVKTIVTLQAFVRGFIDRCRHQRETKKLKQTLAKAKLMRKIRVVAKLAKMLALNHRMMGLGAEQARRAQVACLLAQSEKSNRQRYTACQLIGTALAPILLSFKLRRIKQHFVNWKKLVRSIERLYAAKRLHNTLQQRITKKRILKEYQRASVSQQRMLSDFSQSNVSFPQNMAFGVAEQFLGRKADICINLMEINIIGKDSANNRYLIKNLKETLASLKKTESTVINLSLQDECLLMISNKNVSYFLPLTSDRASETKFQTKLTSAVFFKDTLLYCDESGSAKAKQLTGPGNQSPDIVFGACKISDVKIKNFNLAASSTCGKLFLRNNLAKARSPLAAYQFKRPIARIAMGNGFMIVTDEGGVLYGVGDNQKGQLGLGGKPQSNDLEIINSIAMKKEIVRGIACGREHSVVCTSTGKVFGFGSNERFQLSVNPRRILGSGLVRKPIELSPGWVVKPAKIQVACG